MIRWEQGRAEVDRLLSESHVEIVPPSTSHAELLLAQADRHVKSAAVIRESDTELAFSAAYDGARKSLTAVLAVQGLRPTSRGGHIATYRAVLAQADPPMGSVVKPFDWMRRTRNDVEYPQQGDQTINSEDVDEAIGYAEAIIAMSTKLVATMPAYRP